MAIQEERQLVEKELQVVMRDAASLRRDFTRMSFTNSQRSALEGSTVFRDTELGQFMEDSEAAGLDTALLAQVNLPPMRMAYFALTSETECMRLDRPTHGVQGPSMTLSSTFGICTTPLHCDTDTFVVVLELKIVCNNRNNGILNVYRHLCERSDFDTSCGEGSKLDGK